MYGKNLAQSLAPPAQKCDLCSAEGNLGLNLTRLWPSITVSGRAQLDRSWGREGNLRWTDSEALLLSVPLTLLSVGEASPQWEWRLETGSPSSPGREQGTSLALSLDSVTPGLPWTSMTVRAPRVRRAPLLSFPRTSWTICAIWSLLFSRKSWQGHRRGQLVKLESPPLIPSQKWHHPPPHRPSQTPGHQPSSPLALSSSHKLLDYIQMHNTNWKQPNLKDYILFDFIFMTSWKRQNYGGGKQIGGCQRLGVGKGGDYKGHEGIWGITQIFAFVKTQNCTLKRVLLYINYTVNQNYQKKKPWNFFQIKGDTGDMKTKPL